MNKIHKKRVKRKKKLAGRRTHELNLQTRDRKTPEQRRISTKLNGPRNSENHCRNTKATKSSITCCNVNL